MEAINKKERKKTFTRNLPQKDLRSWSVFFGTKSAASLLKMRCHYDRNFTANSHEMEFLTFFRQLAQLNALWSWNIVDLKRSFPSFSLSPHSDESVKNATQLPCHRKDGTQLFVFNTAFLPFNQRQITEKQTTNRKAIVQFYVVTCKHNWLQLLLLSSRTTTQQTNKNSFNFILCMRLTNCTIIMTHVKCYY